MMKTGPSKLSTGNLRPSGKQPATLLESAKPKGFPSSGSKRLQPIRALDLKNSDIATSPLGSNATADTKKHDMMRMTQPSESDYNAQLITSDKPDGGYSSATNFGVKKGPSPMLNRKTSKGALSGNRVPSIGKSSATGIRPLPKIDHSKQMDKLRSITGRSVEDFAATATSSDSVQFSKPKIGIKGRGGSSSTTSYTRVQGANSSKNGASLRLNAQNSEGKSASALDSGAQKENLIKQRKRVSSQGMRNSQNKIIASDDGTNQPTMRIRSNYLAPNIRGQDRNRKQLPPQAPKIMNKHASKELLSPSRPKDNNRNALSPVSMGNKEESPAKSSKIAGGGLPRSNKYANVPSKISSGVATTSTKPPVPNFAANRVKRQVE